MRLAPCVLLPAVVSAAKSSLGSLYVWNDVASNSEASTLSVKADTARLIIASHLGLDRFHSLQGQDESALELINRVAPAESLFSPKDAASVAFVLSSVSEDELPFSLDSAHVADLQIKNPPSFHASEKLVDDLAHQSGLQASLSDMRQGLVSSFDGPIFKIAQDWKDLASTYDTLTRQHYTILNLNVPNDTTIKATYGTYDMPSSSHQKRQFQEAPLITDATKTVSPLKATHTPSSNNTSPNTPLRGILPRCFTSKSACESQTRNCTGHGSCVLLHTDQDATESSSKCYACSCKADVRTTKNGLKKTTRWGGPACQKKDVVMPFWLIATFSVFFAFVVSWGIGLLYTMGSQELPSVIGAGVSGPRAK